MTYEDLAAFDPARPPLPLEVCQAVEISIKYQGYIERQLRQVQEMKKLENKPLPAELDYTQIEGLQPQKLNQIKPLNLGQASRVSGVSPADIAVLMIYLEK